MPTRAWARLLGHLERLGVYDRTLVVFLADHGEGLGEHGELTHSYLLYRRHAARAARLVRLPPGLPGRGRVVEQRVGTVDVMPTIWTCWAFPPAGRRRSEPAGAFDPAYPRPRPAELYAETLSARLSQGWSEMRAVIQADHKYVHGGRPELFDLGADPDELRNRVADEPERAAVCGATWRPSSSARFAEPRSGGSGRRDPRAARGPWAIWEPAGRKAGRSSKSCRRAAPHQQDRVQE
jgi:arylsulfatase A-like enzyme